MIVGCGSELTSSEPNGDERRQPRSPAEVKAAEIALAFASDMRAGRAAEACQVLAGRPARQFHCGGTPRVPGDLKALHGGRFKVIDVFNPAPADGVHDMTGVIGIGLTPGFPGLEIDVDASGHVIGVNGFGYA
jgi:hypothetical protein